MDEERDGRGRLVGEQIDAWDRAVRKARLRRSVLFAVVGACAWALLGAVGGLVLGGGVDVAVTMAAAGSLAGILIGAIQVGYAIYTHRDEYL
ncbi:hypothetical protein BDK92_5433 [Micromonospora pisi]|uniref:Uncharacterized protein n=1 Tax=Micromonospora pisi TaxID=589240 RepID=A0A495JSK3_9ACTN|nr:hypothetical protein BDK92_5433 [Micromonospora pisi]